MPTNMAWNAKFIECPTWYSGLSFSKYVQLVSSEGSGPRVGTYVAITAPIVPTVIM